MASIVETGQGESRTRQLHTLAHDIEDSAAEMLHSEDGRAWWRTTGGRMT